MGNGVSTPEGVRVFVDTGRRICVGGRILISGLNEGTSSNLGVVGMKLLGICVCSKAGKGNELLLIMDDGRLIAKGLVDGGFAGFTKGNCCGVGGLGMDG